MLIVATVGIFVNLFDRRLLAHEEVGVIAVNAKRTGNDDLKMNISENNGWQPTNSERGRCQPVSTRFGTRVDFAFGGPPSSLIEAMPGIIKCDKPRCCLMDKGRAIISVAKEDDRMILGAGLGLGGIFWIVAKRTERENKKAAKKGEYAGM